MRIGLVGAGRIGACHAGSLSRLAGVDEVLLADPDPARVELVAADTSARPARMADLLDRADGVVVATPTGTHAQLIRRIADAGLPIFCEKPVAADVAETRAVLAHVAAAGVALHVGFQRRFDAGFAAVREAVRAGELGVLHTVRACTSDPRPPSPEYLAHSGGIFRDCAVHDFDAVRWITGQEVTEVSALGGTTGAAHFAEHGDVDTAVAVLTLSGGCLASCTATRYNGGGYDVRLEACGRDGTLVAGLDARAPLPSAEPGWPAPGTPYQGFADRFAAAYSAELAAFVEVVRGERDAPCTGADALAALLVAEAAERSRREHRPVRVEEVA
ncbi:myo-inositol 2-dehydrogenase [Actinocatenispora thailandica]|uniref:Myo-inositol 2-dehydrogenase n=1 Tax=Actinocatenispora thailandica TaxID=227318 RepID=A0A7R7DQE4_9ACTN|nr:Gfo/Idh/MocA family oxidoreductase [Actinocatenispora thailandica]BCJ35923.1 myo-inositol 2-dehydrogenase [Actinocatenispora thailandica]